MEQNSYKNPLVNIKFAFRLIFYISVFLLMVNVSPIVDSITHQEIPYFDEEHLIIGLVAEIICILLFVFLEIFFRYIKNALKKIKILETYLRRFNNEVQHLGKQKGCYPKWLWEKTMFI